MPFLILFGGLIAVRIIAKIMEEWAKNIRVFVSEVVAVLIGLWALSLDVNSFENALNAILVLPAMLGVGASLIAVTLGWVSDGGIWSESFSIGSTSYGKTVGRMSITSKIFLSMIASIFIFFFIFAFSGYVAFIIYFIFHGILLLVGLFREE